MSLTTLEFIKNSISKLKTLDFEEIATKDNCKKLAGKLEEIWSSLEVNETHLKFLKMAALSFLIQNALCRSDISLMS